MDIRIKRIGAWILTICMVVSLTPGRFTAFALEATTDEVLATETAEEVANTEAQATDADAKTEEADDSAEAEATDADAKTEEADDSAKAEATDADAKTEEADDSAEAEAVSNTGHKAEIANLMAVERSYYVGTFAELKEAVGWSNASDDGSFNVGGTRYTSITLENKGHEIKVEQELLIQKTLTIDLALVTLKSTGAHRVFKVSGNLTLTASQGCGGIAGGNVGSDNGGAILVEEGATLTLKDAGFLTIHDGIAAKGGGVYVAGTFTMEGGDGQIYGNTAGQGGGVYVAGTGNFPLNNGKIHNNTATTDGGGVYVEAGGVFDLKKASITDNTATNGGGVYVNGGTLNMSENAAITTNSATNGGGIYVAKGAFDLSAGTIQGNKATNGGGVYFADGAFNLNGGGKIVKNEAANAGGGVYVMKTGFKLTGGEITENKITTTNDLSATGKAKGGGVYVHNGVTFELVSGVVQDNIGKEKQTQTNEESGEDEEVEVDARNNVYLFGTYNNYKPDGNKRDSNTGRINITGNLSSAETKVGLTVEAFEMDEDHQALYISEGNSYATSNAENDFNTNISKFIMADHDDWAIVLVEDDIIKIQDEFNEHSRVAIAINQWKYLQDMIFRAVTGNASNSVVVVSQNVTPQDNDRRLIVGTPYDEDYKDEKIVPYQGVKNPLEKYPTEEEATYRKQITLDLHGYSINRLLYNPDGNDVEEARDDGYVIRVDNGYELTVLNVRSDDIGKITGGKDTGKGQGKGGGVYVEKGAGLVLQAGDVSGNYSKANGGGIYVDEGASFHMNGATSKVTYNKADGNGGGVYIAGAPMAEDVKSDDVTDDDGNVVTPGEVLITAGVEFAYGSISNNSAANGGGIYSKANDATIKLGGKDAEGKATFTEIFKNSAKNGGGVFVESGVVELTNSVSKLYDNTASNEGGGVFVKGGVNGADDNAEFKITLGEITNNKAGVAVE